MTRPLLPTGTLMALLGLALLGVAVVAERLNDERHRVATRAAVQMRLIEVRDRLNNRLLGDLQLMRGLVAVVNLEPQLDQRRFELAAGPLLEGETGLRHIAAAPDMVVQMVVPLAGNERAIGLDYRSNPAQSEAARRALTARTTVLAGPVDLVQGGVGLVARMPVFVRDGSGGERFWGLIAAVIDAETLYRGAGLLDGASPVELGLRGKDASGPGGPVFFGRPALFDESPVVTDIELPHGSWRLAAVPRGGWPADADNAWLLRGAFLAVGLLVLGAFRVLSRALGAASAARERADHARDLVETVLEGAPDAMLQLDSNGRIVRANTQAVHLFGRERPQLVGQPIETLIPVLRDVADPTSEERRQRCSREVSALRADGSALPVELSLSPVQTDEGLLVTAAIRDISERRRAEEQLRESEMRFRGLTENSSDWIWVIGLDGRLTYANDRGLELLGLDRSDFIDLREFGTRVHPDDIAKQHTIFSRAVQTGSGWRGVQLRWRHRDGSYRTLESNATPIVDARGQLTGFQGVDRDITERLAAEAELERHRHSLEQLVQERTAQLAAAMQAAEAGHAAKSAFLANMSHEVRTPLNAITGMAHLVRRSGVSREQAARLATLESAAHHLAELIDGIFDLARIDAGKVALAAAPVDLRAIAAGVVASLTDAARAKGLAIEADVDVPPGALLGDPGRLRQALWNLASNAVKFTDRGRVAVRVRMEADLGDTVRMRFEVHDTGPGVALEAQKRLFAAFEQADSTSTRSHGGTGLGLVITRRLAQLMGGDAGLHSVPGDGSDFWFTANLARGAASDAPDRSPDADHQAGGGGRPAREGGSMMPLSMQGPHDAADAAPPLPHASGTSADAAPVALRVLLAEDEPVNRAIATALLESLGAAVDAADDGVDAVEQAALQDYDLILMDMQMPRMDGLEATRRIRALARHARTPIVAITANAFESDREACIAAGMDDFVTKPIDAEALRAVLTQRLAQRRD